jgi:hypothetical protein
MHSTQEDVGPCARKRQHRHRQGQKQQHHICRLEPEDDGLTCDKPHGQRGRYSTAITTNKSVKDWPGILACDEAMTAAVLDRLLHKSVVLNVRGRSYRLQELEKTLK